MFEEEAFIEWKAEQYKDQSTEGKLEFVEHLHNFPRYFKKTFLDGYHECQKEHEGKYKTAYIKGIRTMANALKDYDRTNGAWTDYFEHTVEEVLNKLLKEIE